MVTVGGRQSGGPSVSRAVDQDLERAPRLGPLSWYARRRKVDYFLPFLPRDGLILDVGCGDNWFKGEAAARGWHNVVGFDLRSTADIVGNVHDWREHGLQPHSADVVVAFELLEHGDFADTFHDLLKPDGLLVVTTPLPRMDPICRVLERFRILQERSSPHTHLTDLRELRRFTVVERRVRAAISQWGMLRPA